jgi:hypothetical protein
MCRGALNQRMIMAVCLLAAVCIGCEPRTNFYVLGLRIDPEKRLIPVGPKSLNHPDSDSYYMFFYTATQLTIVNHFATQTPNHSLRQLLYLEADHGRLLRTVKTEEIETGLFGAITTEKTCFYRPSDQNYLSSVKVLIQSGQPEIGREIPSPATAATPGVPQLTSLSIVRFHRSDSSLIFGSGNYEADGSIGSIHTGMVARGELQPGSSITVSLAPGFDDVRKTSGLPLRVGLNDYLRLRKLPLPKISNAEEPSLVILVYGFGELIRVDSLQNGALIASRYLKPTVTEEERLLNTECDDGLRRQHSLGKSTVQ